MKIFKKTAFLLAALMMVLEVSVGFQAVDVSAAAATPTKAYKAYISHYIYDNFGDKNAKYVMRDLNNDGTPELLVKYTVKGKNAFKVYTYRNKEKKEIVQVLNIKSDGVSMMVKGKKILVTSKKGNTLVTVDYRLNGYKMLKYHVYENRGTGYFCDGKAISEKTYNKNVTAAMDDYTNAFAGAKKVKK